MTGVLAEAKSAVACRLASHRNAIMWRPACRPRTEAKSPVSTRPEPVRSAQSPNGDIHDVTAHDPKRTT